jgi:hypothetical protein
MALARCDSLPSRCPTYGPPAWHGPSPASATAKSYSRADLNLKVQPGRHASKIVQALSLVRVTGTVRQPSAGGPLAWSSGWALARRRATGRAQWGKGQMPILSQIHCHPLRLESACQNSERAQIVVTGGSSRADWTPTHLESVEVGYSWYIPGI